MQRVAAGQPVRIGAHNAAPGSATFLLLSGSQAPQSGAVAGLDGRLKIAGPISVIGPIVAGSDRRAQIQPAVPAGAPTGRLFVQAAVLHPGSASQGSLTDVGVIDIE